MNNLAPVFTGLSTLVTHSAVATGWGGRTPQTTACAPPFRFTQNIFLEQYEGKDNRQ